MPPRNVWAKLQPRSTDEHLRHFDTTAKWTIRYGQSSYYNGDRRPWPRELPDRPAQYGDRSWRAAGELSRLSPAWFSNYRTLANGQNVFNVNLRVQNLTDIMTPQAGVLGEHWELTWSYGGATDYA